MKVSIPQSVWWIRMISLVPNRRWLIASERISSSVTTPPALRMTWASPSFEAEDPVDVEPGVHAREDGDLLGRRQRQRTAELRRRVSQRPRARTKARAASATSPQWLSMTREWPTPGISTISVTWWVFFACCL